MNNHVLDALVDMYGEGYKPVALFHFTAGPTVLISDPNVVESMYTTNNKFFDKHPIIKDLTLCMLGKSILFTETSKEWKEARMTISPAFYKGRLINLVEIARESIRFSVGQLKR